MWIRSRSPVQLPTRIPCTGIPVWRLFPGVRPLHDELMVHWANTFSWQCYAFHMRTTHDGNIARKKAKDFLIPNEGSAGYRRDSWGSTDLLLMKEKREKKRGSIFMVIIKDPAPSPTSAGWRREGGQTVTGSMCQSSSHCWPPLLHTFLNLLKRNIILYL